MSLVQCTGSAGQQKGGYRMLKAVVLAIAIAAAPAVAQEPVPASSAATQSFAVRIVPPAATASVADTSLWQRYAGPMSASLRAVPGLTLMATDAADGAAHYEISLKPPESEGMQGFSVEVRSSQLQRSYISYAHSGRDPQAEVSAFVRWMRADIFPADEAFHREQLALLSDSSLDFRERMTTLHHLLMRNSPLAIQGGQSAAGMTLMDAALAFAHGEADPQRQSAVLDLLRDARARHGVPTR